MRGLTWLYGSKFLARNSLERNQHCRCWPGHINFFYDFVSSEYVFGCNAKFCLSYWDTVYFKQLWLVNTPFTQYILDNLWKHLVHCYIGFDVAVVIRRHQFNYSLTVWWTIIFRRSKWKYHKKRVVFVKF